MMKYTDSLSIKYVSQPYHVSSAEFDDLPVIERKALTLERLIFILEVKQCNVAPQMIFRFEALLREVSTTNVKIRVLS